MMNPPESPPSWYCDFSIPNNMLPTFQPLVHLIGLDTQNNQTHRNFWHVLSMKNAGKDFLPKYIIVLVDHKYREKKNKLPESMEYYIPRGILKKNWIHKHVDEIPSAVVIFFDMDWSDPQWNERKTELTRQIKIVKGNLAAHGTQILIMLLKPPGSVEDNFNTDRASAFCAAAEIPPKYLFVLAHSNMERIQACVQRLEIGMREISKSCYSNKIKRVKGLKDKVTVTPLLVRYNFKIGVFQEIRKDAVASLTHYHSAFEALLTIKATDANVQELKMVAAVLTYRICRIFLSKEEGKEAKNHFEKHIRSFLKIEGNKDFTFEHFAWLSQQYHQFGDLLKQFYRPGSSTIPDPISYFISAGKFSEKRRDAFSLRVTTAGKPTWPCEMNPYNGSVPVKLHCIGQRPWWSNPFSQDYLYAIEDRNTIQALTYFESLCKHSDYIISHWGIASEICRESQRVRTRCQLMSMIGSEFLKVKDYNKCIMLMTHILRELGQGDWKNIIYDVANRGLTAAFAASDIPTYCNFLIILLKRDIVHLISPETQDLLWSNLNAVLNARVPKPINNVEVNTGAWETALATPEWTAYVEIHNQSILECQVFFLTEAATLKDSPTIRFVLKNQSTFVLNLQKYGVRVNPPDYNCELKTDLRLDPGQETELELSLKPLARDISKQIQLHVGYVNIGLENKAVLLHFSPSSVSEWLWSKDPGGSGDRCFSLIRIDQSKPLVTISADCSDPILLNEWYKVNAIVQNIDEETYSKILVTCQLQTLNGMNAALTVDPHSPPTSTTLFYMTEIHKLDAGQSIELVMYLKTSVLPSPGDFKLSLKIKYVDSFGQALTSERIIDLNVIQSFEVTQSLLDLQGEPMENVPIKEDFVLKSVVTNTSQRELRLQRCSTQVDTAFFELRNEPDDPFAEVVLSPNEELVHVTLLLATDIGSNSAGLLELTWMRVTEAERPIVNVSQLPILPITTVIDNTLYLKASFSNNGQGKVKHPMVGRYTVYNKSNTVFNITILMETSEAFMNAGPKRLSIKLYGRDSYNFEYILFPLTTGQVDVPKLCFFTPPNGTTILEPIELPFRQNSPKTLYIMP